MYCVPGAGKEKWKWKSLSRVWLSVTPWTVAHQFPLSVGFSRQEYWSGLPFPSPGESSQPRDQTQVSCIAGRHFNLWATRAAHIFIYCIFWRPLHISVKRSSFSELHSVFHCMDLPQFIQLVPYLWLFGLFPKFVVVVVVSNLLLTQIILQWIHLCISHFIWIKFTWCDYATNLIYS